MQTSSPLFQNKHSFAQAAKNVLKQIDLDALVQSHFCKKLLESFVFLLKNSIPFSFIEAVTDFPGHAKNCLDAHLRAQEPNNSVWAKIQSLFKVFGMFVSPLVALCGSVISFIALIILSILTTIAMVAAALTKVFIDTLSQILRFDFNKNLFSFFFKLSETFIFKAPYEFFKAFRSWVAPASAGTSNQKPGFNFFKLASLLLKKGSLQELFSVMENLQATLSLQGLKINDLFQGENQPKAVLAAIEELSRQGFTSQENPALQTIVQCVDILLGTAGTTATIERKLASTLEAIGLGLQRSQESTATVTSWAAQDSHKDLLLQHSVPGLIEIALSSNGAFNLLFQHRDKMNDFLEVVERLVSLQDNSPALMAICQAYHQTVTENFPELINVGAGDLESHFVAALTELRSAPSSAKNAILERFLVAITPEEINLDDEQKEVLALVQAKFKKDFLAAAELEKGVLEQGLARLIIASLHNKKLPSLDSDIAGQNNSMKFITTIMHRLQQVTPEQQSLIFDLTIAQLLPSFDKLKELSVHATAQEHAEVEAFNTKRSFEKNKLKSLMLKVISFYNNPQELLAHLESEEIDVLRQPEHQDMLRVISGYAIYQSYGYNPAVLTADRDQQIRAGLLDAPLSFQKSEWVKHLAAMRNAEPLARHALVERAIAELLPHLNMAVNQDASSSEVESESVKSRLDQKESFKASLFNLAQQPLTVSTAELANQVFDLPVYDYYRTPKCWLGEDAMGAHFLDNLVYVALNHSGVSSAKILDIMRRLTGPLSTSEQLTLISDILTSALGPTEQEAAAGQSCHRFMVKDFMQKNQAGLLRFMSKTLLKLCPPSDLPANHAEKEVFLAQLEEGLLSALRKTISNPSQIEDISVGLVNLAVALKNNDPHCLHQAALTLSPTLASLLENIPSAETSALSRYMNDLDVAIRSAVGFDGIPQLTTLSRYQRLGAHYGVGLSRVLPAAAYGWKGYRMACHYATSVSDTARNKAKSLYQNSVQKATELALSLATQCRQSLIQNFVTAQETVMQTEHAVRAYCHNSITSAMSVCTQYSFNTAYNSLFSGVTGKAATDAHEEQEEAVLALEETVNGAEPNRPQYYSNWGSALIFSVTAPLAKLYNLCPKFGSN